MAPTNSLVDENNANAMIQPDFIYNYTLTGSPPHKLELKKGVLVMVIRNILCPHLLNGECFIVVSISRITIRVADIDDDGNTKVTFLLHRINFQFEFSDVIVIRRPFSVRPAFVVTVHKS